jgi:integrase
MSNKGGRVKGSTNQGWFYRAGRGYYCTVGRRMIPLRGPDGKHLTDFKTTKKKLAEARALIKVELPRAGIGTTVKYLADRYLAYMEENNRPKTVCIRKPYIEEFSKQFGDRAAELIDQKLVFDWLNSHTGWGNGTRRMVLQALLAMFNLGARPTIKLVVDNPIKGMKVPRCGARITFVDPDQRKAIEENAKPDLALACRLLYLTQLRPGEFVSLTGEQFQDDMLYIPADKSKTHRPRHVVLVPEALKLVKENLKPGILFHNSKGTPWKEKNLNKAFKWAKRRAEKKGVKFYPGTVLYSLRHSGIKDGLRGLLTGSQISIDDMAENVGNTRKVIEEHYIKSIPEFHLKARKNAFNPSEAA